MMRLKQLMDANSFHFLAIFLFLYTTHNSCHSVHMQQTG